MSKEQEFKDFLAQQEVEGYVLGNITGTPEGDMLKYTELKIGANQEKLAREKFYIQRTEAFKVLEDKHSAERLSLSEEWQTKENNL